MERETTYKVTDMNLGAVRFTNVRVGDTIDARRNGQQTGHLTITLDGERLATGGTLGVLRGTETDGTIRFSRKGWDCILYVEEAG